MWSNWSSTSKVLRKQVLIKPRNCQITSAGWTPNATYSSTNSGGVGKWVKRKIYSTIIVLGVTTGGLLVVCTYICVCVYVCVCMCWL